MNVFLSYAVGPWDTPIAARLRAVAAAYDTTILLPDRTGFPHNVLAEDTQQKIGQSDAVIALVTNTTSPEAIQLVNRELQIATQAAKPIIGLVELGGVQLQPAPDTQIVYFDRSNPSAHEIHLMNALDNIRQKRSKEVLTALGGIALFALGFMVLGSLIGDEK